jgi:hypothetical protein
VTNRQILWQQTFYEELSSEPSAPTGVPKMSLLAGIPSAIGNQDGQKVNAYYSNISGFAIDANGEIIFADNKNNNIRKIAKNGSISTLAGGGLTQTELDGLRTGSNYVDGKGSVARFHNPKNLVLDSIGNIYVNDNINKIIRKIDIAGNVTTLAGKVGECDLSAIKNPTQFCDVSSMAIDSAGNIYAAEGNSAIGNPIKKISVSGDMATIVEKASIYPTGWVNMDTIMYKYLPVHLGVDAQGSVYAADPNDRVIRKYVNGALELFSGAEVKNNIGYVDGLAAEVKFSYIAGIAFDKKNNFYVLDNNRIRKVGVDGSVTTTLDLSNACSVADGQINSTKNCWFDNLAIDDNGHFLVQERALLHKASLRRVTPNPSRSYATVTV